MSRKKLNILDAVENLSHIADMDPPTKSKKKKVDPIELMDISEKTKKIATIQDSFSAVHNYLKEVSKDKNTLYSHETQKGIRSMMLLAKDAASKIDKYGALFTGAHVSKASELEEFKNLSKFYLENIEQKFIEGLEKEDRWLEELSEEDDVLDMQRMGLKDLETVKRDQKYELFYIRKEDGSPYFNRNLLRHIKLVTDFDEIIHSLEGEDPLLRIKVIKDSAIRKMAKEIHTNLEKELKHFSKMATKQNDLPMVKKIYSMMMALSLAKEPRNLLTNTLGKSAHLYFHDFLAYLKELVDSTDYYYLIGEKLDKLDSLSKAIVDLLHKTCFFLYTATSQAEDFIGYIESLHTKKKTRSKTSSLKFWNYILDIQDAILQKLNNFPSGPLLKTMDAFLEKQYLDGYEPLTQDNYPSTLFDISAQSFKARCLRIPSPTYQTMINKAEITPEFGAFIRGLDKRCLVINLQNRTDIVEHARCHALESMQQSAQFAKNITVVTLPKDTDFYMQSDTYLQLNSAKEFKEAFNEQILNAEDCGYYFPKSIPKKEINEFSKKCISRIHSIFFAKKNTLSRKNRLDFIEIFLHLLVLKILDITRADYFSLTCKDSIDIGGSFSFGLYSLIKLLGKNHEFEEKEKDFSLWLLFGPSLLIRERCADSQRLSRVISALTTMQGEFDINEKKVIETFKDLYQFPNLQRMEVREIE